MTKKEMKPKPTLDEALTNHFTASEAWKASPLCKLEKQILKMLKGLDITSIEALLVHRVLSEAKRRAKL